MVAVLPKFQTTGGYGLFAFPNKLLLYRFNYSLPIYKSQIQGGNDDYPLPDKEDAVLYEKTTLKFYF